MPLTLQDIQAEKQRRALLYQIQGEKQRRMAAGRVQSPGVVAPTNPPPPSNYTGTGSMPERMFRPVVEGVKGLVHLAGKWGEATDEDIQRNVTGPMIADEKRMGPNPMRGVSEAARTAIGGGQFFTTGLARFADQMVNPEYQGQTTGQAVKGLAQGLVSSGKAILPQAGELYRHTVQNVTGTENPPDWMNAPANLADKAAGLMMKPEEIAAAKEGVREDPFAPFGTATVLAGGLKTGAGLVRGLKPRTAVPEKAPAVPGEGAPEPMIQKPVAKTEPVASAIPENPKVTQTIPVESAPVSPAKPPTVKETGIKEGMSIYAQPSRFPNPKRAVVTSIATGLDGAPTHYQVKIQGGSYMVTPDQVRIPERTIAVRDYNKQFAGKSMAERRTVESSAREFDDLLMQNAGKFLPEDAVLWPQEFQELGGAIGQKNTAIAHKTAIKYLRDRIADQFQVDINTPFGRAESLDKLKSVLGSREKFIQAEPSADWITSDTPFRKAGAGQMPKSMAPGGSEPTTINDIRQHFETALQTPIRTGKYAGQGGRGASGIYKNKADVIRLKDYGDIETLSHEVAHSIDNKTGIKKIYNQFKDELGPLDYEPNKARPSEGFAEYLRHYLTGSGNAKALAPKFTQAFEQFLTDNPELKKTIDQGKGLFDSWRSQGAEARVSAAISKNPTKAPIKDAFKDVKNTYLRKFFDVLTPVRHFTEAAEKAAGRKLRGEENPFDLATALKNKSSARAENWVKDKTTDFDGNPTGDGLSTILSKVKGIEDKAIEYAYAKHGIERWKQGKNPGSDLRDLEYFVEKNKSPELEQFSKDISAYRDRLLQYVVDAGGVDPGTAKLFREIYQSSIPLYREGFETGGVGGQTKFINSAQAVKKAHGSGRIVINPLAGLMKETSRLIKFADERRVGNSIIDAANKYPGLGNWVEKVSLGSKATHLNVEQAVANFKKAGIDLSSMSPDELTKALTTWGQQTHGISSENIITRFKDGRVEAYQVNRELMEGLKGVNTPQVEGFLKFLTYPKKAISAGATALRPSFSLLTNPLRDPWSAMMQSRIWSTTPLQSVKGMVRVGVHKLGLDSKLGLDPTKLDLMRRVGVEQAQFFNSELPKAMENAKQLIADNNRSKSMNVIRHPIDLYRAVLNTPEAGPRTAEFVAVYDKVLKETGNDRTAWIEATNAYQDVTMNFSRSGSTGSFLNQFIPFLNPALQEPGLIARSFRRAPVATTTKGIALMTVPTIALWYENKDKDWYKATPTWEKATFWHIRVGGDGDGGHTLRIPKPFLWGSIFASWPEATLDAIYKHDPQIAIDMAKQTAVQSMPPVTNVLSPFGAAIGEGGYDFFRGRSIVPQSQVENLPPEERFGKYTTETAKKIGGVLGVSPTKVDYTIGAFTGGLGTDVIQAAEKPFTEKAESQTLENTPMIGRLLSRSPYLNKFYDENDKLQEKMKELKVKPETEWSAEDRAANLKGKQYEKIAREMSEIRKRVTQINNSQIPGEAKGIQIDRLNKQMDDLAHKVLYDKSYQMPGIKPAKPSKPSGPISQADIDSIPAHIQVKYHGIKSKSGEKVQMTGSARQVLKDLYAESELYTKILGSLV